MQPEVVSGRNVLEFWRNAFYTTGGENGTPSITFTDDGEEKVVTPRTVCEALNIPIHNYDIFIRDDILVRL